MTFFNDSSIIQNLHQKQHNSSKLTPDNSYFTLQTKKRRSGVAQYTEPHILLAGGTIALERLVPGFKKELVSRGAHSYDAGQGLFVYDFEAPFKRGINAGVEMLGASRRLINETLQDLVVEQGKERLILREKTTVSGLFWERPPSEPESYNVMKTVRGVQGVILNSGEELRADLVIVCNGRKSQLPAWLKEVGLQVPPRLKVDCQMNYATRWMRLPADFNPEKEFYSALVNGRPTLARGATALILEDNLLQISMTGFEGERAPLDHDGWMEYAASLPDQTLYNLAKRCTPLGPITRFASTPNITFQYDKMKLPEGLVITGDAFVALNPVYGQGMSVAAQQAVVLDKILAKVISGKVGDRKRRYIRAMGPQLHKQLKEKVDLGWKMSTCEDMRWPGVKIEGMVKPSVSLYSYLDAIMIGCQQNKRVFKQLLRVSQFVAAPCGMFTPLMLVYATKNMIVAKRKLMKIKKHRKTVEEKPLAVGGVAVTVEEEVPLSSPVVCHHTFAPIRTTPISNAVSIASSDTTNTGYSDGGKDVDLISAEQLQRERNAVAA